MRWFRGTPARLSTHSFDDPAPPKRKARPRRPKKAPRAKPKPTGPQFQTVDASGEPLGEQFDHADDAVRWARLLAASQRVRVYVRRLSDGAWLTAPQGSNPNDT